MSLPLPRKKLRGVSFRNRSLQDIFRSSQEALRVLEVIPVPIGLHNTKIIVLLADGKHQRVHFYNRLLLKDVIPDTFVSSGNLARDIDTLNSLHGCDFNEDDLELVGGVLKAKPNSLGYYEAEETGGEINYCAISLPVACLSPSFMEHLADGSETGKGFILKINGRSFDVNEIWEERGINVRDLIWEETEGNVTVYVETGLVVDQPEESSQPIESDAPEEGTLAFENLSDKCYSIELIPNTGDTFPVVAETSGNISYQQVDNGAIKFTLSPWKSLTCDMTHAKLIEFKPKDYSWKNKERVAIYARVYDDINSEEVETIQIVCDVVDLHTQREFWVPNHGNLKVNTSVAWPTLEPLLSDFSDRFRRYEVNVNTPRVIQTNPVTQTAFLGLYNGVSSSMFQSPVPLTMHLVERNQNNWSIVKDELIGSTSITASDVNDLMNKARDFFTPLLENKGFTVETYSGTNHLSMTNTGFKLTKTSVNNVSIELREGPWKPGWGDWDSKVCYFRQVAVEGDMVTEEGLIDEVWIKLRPYDGSKSDAIQQRSRVIFTTAEGAGIETDPDTYDWIKENNNGEEIIFESCAVRMPMLE